MNTQPKAIMLRFIALAGGLLLCGFLTVAGFFIAPELRRTVAEAGIRELLNARDRSKNGDILKVLIDQIVTPPTSIERLLADIFSSQAIWPQEDLANLSELLMASLLIGVDEAAQRTVERSFPVSESSSRPELLPVWHQQLSIEANPLVEILHNQEKGAQEETRLAAEIEPLKSQCAAIRDELATNLGLAAVRARNITCEWYESGPLQGLPKLSLLRAEPISILALIQSLRAAGSTLPLETADAIERLKPLFSGLQPKMAIISPSLVNLSAEQSRNRENQRKLTSAHFVHQERFLDSLLLTVNSVRYQKLQAPLSHKYRTIAEAAVTILLIE